MTFRSQTYRYEAKKTQKPAIPKNLKKKKAIIVVKRFLGSKGQHEKTIIEIHHEALNMILQEIYGDMENILSDGDGTVMMVLFVDLTFVWLTYRVSGGCQVIILFPRRAQRSPEATRRD